MNNNTKIIIYDDTCPLCAAYTNGFVQTGLLEKEGRKKFTDITPELIAMVDIKRSVNEIPVIDVNTKQVWYGIDALLEILSLKVPFIKTLTIVILSEYIRRMKFAGIISQYPLIICINGLSITSFLLYLVL